jgi:hypothetical protein
MPKTNARHRIRCVISADLIAVVRVIMTEAEIEVEAEVAAEVAVEAKIDEALIEIPTDIVTRYRIKNELFYQI